MATKKTVGCDTSIKGLIPGRKPTYVSGDEMKFLKKPTVSKEEPKLSIKEKVFSHIQKQGEGYTFSSKDLLHTFSKTQFYKAIALLVKEDKIVKALIRGIYYYPKKYQKEYYSCTNGSPKASGIDIAKVLARKYGWNIRMSEDTAFRMAAFSSHDAGNTYYYSGGASKIYKISDNAKLIFVHTDSLNSIALFKKHSYDETPILEKSAMVIVLRYHIPFDYVYDAARKFGMDYVKDRETILIQNDFDKIDAYFSAKKSHL